MVRSWQGKVVVDIREFYVKDGKQLPGKKGPCSSLSLSLSDFFGVMLKVCCIVYLLPFAFVTFGYSKGGLHSD
jgi:hypothetical protein